MSEASLCGTCESQPSWNRGLSRKRRIGRFRERLEPVLDGSLRARCIAIAGQPQMRIRRPFLDGGTWVAVFDLRNWMRQGLTFPGPHSHSCQSTMDAVRNYAHWFVMGMGHVLSLCPLITPISEGTSMDALGRDFQAVGDDLRGVMRRTPATPETALRIGEAAQLEFNGIR